MTVRLLRIIIRTHLPMITAKSPKTYEVMFILLELPHSFMLVCNIWAGGLRTKSFLMSLDDFILGSRTTVLRPAISNISQSILVKTRHLFSL